MEETKTSVSNEDQEFIKSLYHNVLASPRDTQLLKKAFGRPINDDMSTYISFLKVSGGHIFEPKEKIYFLIACMFCLYEKPGSEGRYVSFEALLGRLYGNTDSADKDIAFLVNCRDLDDGMFLKRFVSYARRCKDQLRGGERMDFYRLLQDLKFWNSDDKKVQIRWAREITKKG